MQPRYIEFVIRVHADGRRERHARLYVQAPDCSVRHERRPEGKAAAWAQEVIESEWMPLRRREQRRRSAD
jgi:hypothetical protein